LLLTFDINRAIDVLRDLLDAFGDRPVVIACTAAAYLPCRKAARTDPITSLRHE
jgi:hypothetical protein